MPIIIPEPTPKGTMAFGQSETIAHSGNPKSDRWIRQQAAQGMISPFEHQLIRHLDVEALGGITEPCNLAATKEASSPTALAHPPSSQTGPTDRSDSQGAEISKLPGHPVISYGLSSYGYDLRLSGAEFRIFRHVPGTVVDPKRFNPQNLEPTPLHQDKDGSEFFILPGHSYGLGVALERLSVPENVTVLCIGKSTYARAGIIANLTPAEAGWRGHLTLEVSNSSPADCRIYANEGIVQLLFFESEPCAISYEQRRGKYQDQPEQVVFPRV